jgi:hypothetical protein
MGLSTRPWPPEQADDPLSQTIVDYVALIETSLSTAEAARMLRVDVSRIRQRLRERSPTHTRRCTASTTRPR